MDTQWRKRVWLAGGLAALLTAAAPARTAAQLAAFSAIEVPHGGHVIVRSGASQRVTVTKGRPECVRTSVNRSGVLVIDKLRRGCSRSYELEVTIVTPRLARITFANGGSIQAVGTFRPQGDLDVSLSNGGTVDVRSMVAERVTASVEQGGRILTIPRGTLVARVNNGGSITYWGDAQVRSSVEHGGVVEKGDASGMNEVISFRRRSAEVSQGPYARIRRIR